MHSTSKLSTCVLVLLQFLAGCAPDNRLSDIQRCTAEAQRKAAHGDLPYLQASDSAEVRHDKIGSEIADCMAKSGYRHDQAAMADGRCVDDVDFNAYCYRHA